MRRRLFGDDDGAPAYLRTVNSEALYGAIERGRAAIWPLRRRRRAPTSGPPRAILEVLIQIGIYAGFAASEEAVEAAAITFAERGVAMPEDAAREDSLEALAERGAALMRQLHGDRATQGYAAPGNAVTGALYPLAIQYGYGEIWFRPGLELRQRALIAVAAFGAEARRPGSSASRLNMGLSRTEVIEAVIQTAPLSGFAPALNALAGLSEVFGD